MRLGSGNSKLVFGKFIRDCAPLSDLLTSSDNPARILVIEDDGDLIGIMRDILETDGHIVISVRNALDALSTFEAEKPDLILSDIMMPAMDGFAVLQAVRSHPDGLAVPFLFVSARTERRDLTPPRDLHADDFIFQPFGVDELR